MATQIKKDGTRVENCEYRGLKAKQEAVGGYIEPVYLQDGRIVLVNEEGLLEGLPVNEEAFNETNCMLMGDVLILSQEEWNEE
tara:strand:- start:102 stop:350 length:249 start_codon:yes stop_codon:yes gene_type:complete